MDEVYAAIGFLGGLVLAFAQIPQIYRVQSRKSSSDISYAYQLVFATGVGMFLVYYGYYGIWSLFLPSVLSFACILYLIGLKIYLETIQTRDMSIDELREDGLGRALLSHDVDPESREG